MAKSIAPPSFKPLIAAIATASPKEPWRRQDRVEIFKLDDGGLAAVVLDGVGAWEDSGMVADQAMALLGDELRSQAIEDLPHLPERVNRRLLTDLEGATTLVAVAGSTEGDFAYTMTGNGSVIEVRAYDRGPDFDPDLTFTDLAFPQMTMTEGRPALSSHLPWAQGAPPTSAGLRFAEPGVPRLMLTLSDGIASDEERPMVASPEKDRAFKAVPMPLFLLLEELTRSWRVLATGLDPSILLQIILDSALSRALDRGDLDDDATVGAVMWRPPATMTNCG